MPSTSCCTPARRAALRLAPAQDPDRARGRVRRRAPVRRAPPRGRSRGEPRQAREVLASVFALLYLRLALSVFESRPARHRLPCRGARLFRAFGADQGERLLGSRARVPPLRATSRRGACRDASGRVASARLPVLAGSAATLVGVLFVRRWAVGGFLKPSGYGIFEVENALATLGPGTRAVQRLRGSSSVIWGDSSFRCICPERVGAWSIQVAAPGSPVAIAADPAARGARGRGSPAGCPRARRSRSGSCSSASRCFRPRISFSSPERSSPSGSRTCRAPGLCLAAGALLAGTAPTLSALAPSGASSCGRGALLLAARRWCETRRLVER